MAQRRSKQDAGWSPAQQFVAASVITVALLSLLTPVVPIVLAAWGVAATVVYLWPAPLGGRYKKIELVKRAAKVSSIRKYLWLPFKHPIKGGVWRWRPAGDNDGDYGRHDQPHHEQALPPSIPARIQAARRSRRAERQQLKEKLGEGWRDKARAIKADAKRARQEEREQARKSGQKRKGRKRRRRFVALDSLAALLTALFSVGLEQILALGVSKIPWPSEGQLIPSVEPFVLWLATGRAWWLPLPAAFLGWGAAKSYVRWKRARIAAEIIPQEDPLWRPPKVSAPSALVPNRHVDELRHAWPLRPLLAPRSLLSFIAIAGGAVALVVTCAPVVGLAPSLLTFASMGLLAGVGVALRPWVTAQREPWVQWRKEVIAWKHRHWPSAISSKQPPDLVTSMFFPAPEAGAAEKCPPMTRRLAFTLSTGADFSSYRDLGDKLKPAVACDLVHVAPGNKPGGARQPIWSYFSIEHELAAYDEWVGTRSDQWKEWRWDWKTDIVIDRETAYHDPTLPEETRTFLFQRQLAKAMLDLNIGVLLSGTKLGVRSIGADKPVYLRFQIPLYGKITFPLLMRNLDNLADKLRAGWLRFEPLGSDNVALGHMCAVHPDGTEFPSSVERAARRDVLMLDWQWWMIRAKLFGSDQTSTPTLISAQETNKRKDDDEATIHRIKFRLPEGLTIEKVRAAVSKLSTASNFPYISIEQADLPSQFTLLAGMRDPLNDKYLFDDWADKRIAAGKTLLGEPKAGEPRTGWCVGVGVDGEPIFMEWDHQDEPHLLVAGSSGSGKSMLINSMLIQLLHNNHQDDVELWMMEPKNELHRYAHKPHVRVFVDEHVGDGSIYHVASRTFGALVAEMDRRYALMRHHPLQPQKISEARHIATQDPASSHLAFRHIYVIVEECTSYFRKPGTGDKEDLANYQLMMSHLHEIARKSRASGIFMVLATQDPVKEALPSGVKANCRRVGLKTNDVVRSRVIIDRKGLETIDRPGRGLVTGKHGYTGYRAFFFRAPSHEEPDVPNDLGEYLARIPDDNRWPKLPPGVDPAGDVEIAHDPEID